jgi:hypothetical protein
MTTTVVTNGRSNLSACGQFVCVAGSWSVHNPQQFLSLSYLSGVLAALGVRGTADELAAYGDSCYGCWAGGWGHWLYKHGLAAKDVSSFCRAMRLASWASDDLHAEYEACAS